MINDHNLRALGMEITLSLLSEKDPGLKESH
jgi:hypothetical protein